MKFNKIRCGLLVAFLILYVFIFGCSQQNSSSSILLSRRGVEASDFAPGELRTHFLKHKYEFSYTSEYEYLTAAKNLLNCPTSRDVLEKTRPNGDILRYRLSTNEFAVMTKDGLIKTYFKADYRYWMKQ